eukprot:761513-Hanusia_phi.AAC.1
MTPLYPTPWLSSPPCRYTPNYPTHSDTIRPTHLFKVERTGTRRLQPAQCSEGLFSLRHARRPPTLSSSPSSCLLMQLASFPPLLVRDDLLRSRPSACPRKACS